MATPQKIGGGGNGPESTTRIVCACVECSNPKVGTSSGESGSRKRQSPSEFEYQFVDRIQYYVDYEARGKKSRRDSESEDEAEDEDSSGADDSGNESDGTIVLSSDDDDVQEINDDDNEDEEVDDDAKENDADGDKSGSDSDEDKDGNDTDNNDGNATDNNDGNDTDNNSDSDDTEDEDTKQLRMENEFLKKELEEARKTADGESPTEEQKAVLAHYLSSKDLRDIEECKGSKWFTVAIMKIYGQGVNDCYA